ncbi:MAG TPA: hypothetical protein VK565_00190, partial [Gemmatimonadaceae bacterium]|nr:hypothetical protein [Gemmatimonadaceae bacterium]
SVASRPEAATGRHRTALNFPSMTGRMPGCDGHIRRSNVIESSFATVRHRTDRTKGCLTRDGMLAMIYKLGLCAERSWRRLRGFEWLAKIVDGVKFHDGVEVQNVVRSH